MKRKPTRRIAVEIGSRIDRAIEDIEKYGGTFVQCHVEKDGYSATVVVRKEEKNDRRGA